MTTEGVVVPQLLPQPLVRLGAPVQLHEALDEAIATRFVVFGGHIGHERIGDHRHPPLGMGVGHLGLPVEVAELVTGAATGSVQEGEAHLVDGQGVGQLRPGLVGVDHVAPPEERAPALLGQLHPGGGEEPHGGLGPEGCDLVDIAVPPQLPQLPADPGWMRLWAVHAVQLVGVQEPVPVQSVQTALPHGLLPAHAAARRSCMRTLPGR